MVNGLPIGSRGNIQDDVKETVCNTLCLGDVIHGGPLFPSPSLARSSEGNSVTMISLRPPSPSRPVPPRSVPVRTPGMKMEQCSLSSTRPSVLPSVRGHRYADCISARSPARSEDRHSYDVHSRHNTSACVGRGYLGPKSDLAGEGVQRAENFVNVHNGRLL